MIELTKDQSLAAISMFNHITTYTALRRMAKTQDDTNRLKKHQYYVLTGYAGTGKTVCINMLHQMLKKAAAEVGLYGVVTAFTGRACENLNERGVPCSTMHALFYEPVIDDKGSLKYFRQKSSQEILETVGDFVIVEEASMANLDLISKVLDTGCAVVFVGDDAQLPPINGESVFNVIGSGKFESTSMMMLEEIKRTKDGSSINLFADAMRRTGRFDFSVAGDDVSKVGKNQFNLKWLKENWSDWDVILCGTNRTRKKYNELCRVASGFSGDIPNIGERIMCVKNTVVNNGKINNGELYIVQNVFEGQKTSSFQVQKTPDGRTPKGPMINVVVDNNMWSEETRIKENFSNDKLQDFVYGYAVTTHKMQGSSVPNVIFYDEDVSFFLDRQKFRYTAITRPSEKLLVVM